VLARPDGRLVGVQIVGGPGSAKRVDSAAVALWYGASVGDVAGMDLAYAPPFSPVWDPVQIACRRLADRL
jgi:pyridine nucleotide-disulfide oxidoreductase